MQSLISTGEIFTIIDPVLYAPVDVFVAQFVGTIRRARATTRVSIRESSISH